MKPSRRSMNNMLRDPKVQTLWSDYQVAKRERNWKKMTWLRKCLHEAGFNARSFDRMTEKSGERSA